MKITFYLEEGEKILEFRLKGYSRVEGEMRFHGHLSQILFGNGAVTAEKLLGFLREHLGGELSLRQYLDHIGQFGFYSPYQPALKVKVDPEAKRVFALSDIHGHREELEEALSLIELDEGDLLIFLGDYVHGPDSYGVLDWIMALQERYGEQVIALCGNHEKMVLDGSWPIGEERFAKVFPLPDEAKDEPYRKWMAGLPLFYQVGKAVFVHAGIDEEIAPFGYWREGTAEEIFTGKFPADIGKIPNFEKKIVAGHVATSLVAGDPFFHGIVFDGGNHYYIDSTVRKSGVISVILYDVARDSFRQVTKEGLLPIPPCGTNG